MKLDRLFPVGMRMWRVALVLAALLLAHPLAEAQTFSRQSRLIPVGPNPSAIAAQDLTDNGYPDIVTADRGELIDLREQRPANDEISILMAQGGGDYERHHPSLKTGFGPYAIAIANIDALRWPDIIVVNFHAVRHRDIFLYLNLRQEGIFNAVPFRIPDETLTYRRQLDGDNNPLFRVPGLTGLVVHDFNRDGLRDIVTTGWVSDSLFFIPGHAEKYFDESSIKIMEATGGPAHLAMGDFDKNGHMDLAIVMESTGELTLWRGDSTGEFQEHRRFLTRGRMPNKVRVGDVNGDGNLDIVVSHRYSEDSLIIFYGEGNWNFSVSQEIALGTDPQVLEREIRDFVLEDLTGNGRLDMAAACHASSNVVVLINESSGTDKVQRFRRETYSFEGGRPRALCAADLNANGHKDLAVALWDANAVGLLMNNRR